MDDPDNLQHSRDRQHWIKLRHDPLLNVTDRVTLNEAQVAESEGEQILRYRHLSENDRHLVDNVLRGRLPLEDLPKLPSRLVRVYLSSTFTDSIQERNVLMQYVYPKLKEYCRINHNIEFQVVDMRWGVPRHDTDDHSDTDVCLEEINNCRRLSCGPNFVALVGQKYGTRLAPSKLSVSDYEAIHDALQEAGSNVKLLNMWYKKDENATPKAFVLQPISLVLGESNAKQWFDMETRLEQILMKGALLAIRQGRIDETIVETLQMSGTQKELEFALFDESNSTLKLNENTVCYLRTITDIESHMNKPKAQKFMDIIATTKRVDNRIQDKLQTIREVKIPGVIAEKRIMKSHVGWSDPHGIDETAHSEYIDAFREHFHMQMRDLIEYNMNSQTRMQTDGLYEEQLQHWHAADARCRNFVGQEKHMQKILNYLIGETDQPLVLYGEGGVGKTSIIAKASSEVQNVAKTIGLPLSSSCLLRFIGSSPSSSNIRQLLTSISAQIAYQTGRSRSLVPGEYKALKKYFMDMMSRGEFGGLVIIFLDSLDQLTSDDNGQSLDWLPSKLADNVKIIVSTRPVENGILDKLNSKIENKEYIHEVGRLTPEECTAILKQYLTSAERTLNAQQWQVVHDTFRSRICTLPLYIRLAFEDIRRWNSYTEVTIRSIGFTVEECLNKLFDRLEDKHGKIVASHILGYITAFGSAGVSENELVDILSIDDVVLDEIYKIWHPTVRRFPPALLSRLRHDISPYLVERDAQSTCVIGWYHRQFIEVSKERYLSKLEQILHLHGNISDYFLGKWSGINRKPFKYSDRCAKKRCLHDPHSLGFRYPAEQPLIYTGDDHNARFNFRKLSLLPHHLAKCQRYEVLKEEVLFNYNWLHTKLVATNFQQVIADFGLIDDHETTLVEEAFRMAEAAIVENPDVLNTELSGRLLSHFHTFPKIKSLILEGDQLAIKHCSLVSNCQMYTVPGAPLQYICDVGAGKGSEVNIDVIQNAKGVLLTAKQFKNGTLKTWDIANCETQTPINVPGSTKLYASPNGEMISAITGGQLKTTRIDSNEVISDVTVGNVKVTDVAMSNKFFLFTAEQGPSPWIIDIEAQCVLDKLRYKSDAVALSDDGQYTACNDGYNISYNTVPLLERKCLIKTRDLSQQIAFSRDNTRFYVRFQSRKITSYKVDLIDHKATSKDIFHDMEMRDFKMSHYRIYTLVRCSRCLFLIDTSTEKVTHRLEISKEVFIEPLTIFTGVGFTPNDAMVVASRHAYVGVWETKSGTLLRILQSSVSPVSQLFTSYSLNKAITLLEDRSIQIWNLDNMNEKVHYMKNVIEGSVRNIDLSSIGKKILCFGENTNEAKVVDLVSSDPLLTIYHSDDPYDIIEEVRVSPCGRYGITRVRKTELMNSEPWDLLYEDILWDLSTGKKIHHALNCRDVIFSQDDSIIGFITSRKYNHDDWTDNDYVINILRPDTHEEEISEPPPADFVTIPFIMKKNTYMICIMQWCVKTFNENGDETKREFQIRLVANSLTRPREYRNARVFSLNQMIPEAEETDNFVDVRLTHDDKLLLIYVKGIDAFPYNDDGALNTSQHVEKGALIYDIYTNEVIRRFPNFLKANTDVIPSLVSTELSIVIDDKYQVFDVEFNRFVNQMKIKPYNNVAKMVIDGRYLVMISSNQQEIHVVRSRDGYLKTMCYVHGKATCIAVGADDRTIVVGCEDGRIMIMTLILELSDPVIELIRTIPSRCRELAQREGLVHDVRTTQNTATEHRKLSATIRAASREQLSRPPSYKKLSAGVSMMQRSRLVRSQACSLQ
ncbi:unnamed protein product [Owenia fusiformis]|uniref:NACHT domain-containing protein n=1 Tax=Owenia fusiformis TaxID=6347 RepID=A0A8S4Q5K9_OWEFU|nr:unnamed protein product [Owenia fusiformis]